MINRFYMLLGNDEKIVIIINKTNDQDISHLIGVSRLPVITIVMLYLRTLIRLIASR